LAPEDRVLNLGAGDSPRRTRTINLDIAASGTTDCRADGRHLPFRENSFALVISQEVLEHVADPPAVLREIHRVLRKNGTLYCQLPFVIGYHPGPHDFWRFTAEGICEVVREAGFECLERGRSVGPATGFYRIAVEFAAVCAASVVPSTYKPVKGAAALALSPLRLLDPILSRSRQADRIAGGYFVIARKV
jgi:SAM-dependent methyltransferase